VERHKIGTLALAGSALAGLAPAARAQQVLYELTGAAPGDEFGRSVARIAGHLLVGAPLDDGAGIDAGMARVFGGATGAPGLVVRGHAPGDQLGISVGAADVDADGLEDVIVGASGDCYYPSERRHTEPGNFLRNSPPQRSPRQRSHPAHVLPVRLQTVRRFDVRAAR
jgi:hypothetical protein